MYKCWTVCWDGALASKDQISIVSDRKSENKPLMSF